jgi:hypothetical protein
MTALGLAVAVPAVLGYNALLRGNGRLIGMLEAFATGLMTYATTGAPPALAQDEAAEGNRLGGVPEHGGGVWTRYDFQQGLGGA